MVRSLISIMSLILLSCGSDKTQQRYNQEIIKSASDAKTTITYIDSDQLVYHPYDLTEMLSADTDELERQLQGKEIFISGKISEMNRNSDVIYFYDTKLKKGVLVYFFNNPELRNWVNDLDKVVLKASYLRSDGTNVTFQDGALAMYK